MVSLKKKFYVVNNNGQQMIIDTLTSLGFERVSDKGSSDFGVRWVEVRTDIDFGKFREGEQIVNHIANCSVITTKNSLYTTLRTYERSRRKKEPDFSISSFIPQTFRMDMDPDRQEFLRLIASTEEKEKSKKGESIWITKPTSMNQGKGISLSKDLVELQRRFKSGGGKYVIQRYLLNPLLLEGRKFDMRIYMFIASVKPALVFYHEGYCRLSHCEYSADDLENPMVHLTNAAIQRKHPEHKEKGEDTIWTFAKFQAYLAANALAPVDWVQSFMIVSFCTTTDSRKFKIS
eukprot:ANDGO_07586.mRNA.1 putative alpha-tubulin polyglutamylase Ttll1